MVGPEGVFLFGHHPPDNILYGPYGPLSLTVSAAVANGYLAVPYPQRVA